METSVWQRKLQMMLTAKTERYVGGFEVIKVCRSASLHATLQLASVHHE